MALKNALIENVLLTRFTIIDDGEVDRGYELRLPCGA